MADLLDRLVYDGQQTGRPKIGIHAFVAFMREYARGKVSASQIVAQFSLTGAESTQATTLKNAIDSKVTLAEKIDFIESFDDVLIVAESSRGGVYGTKQEIATRMGL